MCETPTHQPATLHSGRLLFRQLNLLQDGRERLSQQGFMEIFITISDRLPTAIWARILGTKRVGKRSTWQFEPEDARASISVEWRA